MKKISFTLLLLVLIMSACSSGGSATEAPATQTPAPTNTALPVPTATKPAATETPVPAREAVISETKNNVSARDLSSKDFAPASVGMDIFPSGGVKTGVDGRARLDLLPEGTILRVLPNSSFTIPEITIENGQPKTTIELLFGRIFILLNGGSLDVKTSMGVASVSGSLMRVEYNPEKKVFKASCLEGHCVLKDKNGKIMELVSGEFSYIEGDKPLFIPKEIYCEEIQEWLQETAKELPHFLAELPNPKDYPEQIRGRCYKASDNKRDDEGYPNP